MVLSVSGVSVDLGPDVRAGGGQFGKSRAGQPRPPEHQPGERASDPTPQAPASANDDSNPARQVTLPLRVHGFRAFSVPGTRPGCGERRPARSGRTRSGEVGWRLLPHASLAVVLVVAAVPEAALVAPAWRAVEPLVHAPEAVQSARIGGIGVVDDAVLEH